MYDAWYNSKSSTSNIWQQLASDWLMPAAGRRNYNEIVNYVGSYGFYWASSPNASNPLYAHTLSFYSSGIFHQGYDNRSYGFSVRCVKNSPNSKTLTLHANWGTKAVIAFTWTAWNWKFTTLWTPTRANSIFSWWYSDSNYTNQVTTWWTVVSNLYAKFTCPAWYTEQNNTCVDITSPTITITTQPSSEYTTGKTVSANITDVVWVSTRQYAIASTCNSWTSATWTTYTNDSTITLDSEDYNDKYVCFKATDTAGNTSYQATNKIEKIDKTAPIFSWKTTFLTTWYTGNQTSIFTYVDTWAGIAAGENTTQCIISTEWLDSYCEVTTTNICDLVWNCNTENQTSNTIKLDKTAPILRSKTSYNDDWYNAPQNSTFIYEDNISWINWNDRVSCTITQEWSTASCNAENTNICNNAWLCNTTNLTSNTIKLDTTAPTCSISWSPSEWTNQDVTLTLNYLVEVNQITDGYKWDGENYTSTKKYTVTENWEYTGYVIDAAGNTGSCSVTVDMIDKTAPEVTLTTISTPKSLTQTATLSCNDWVGVMKYYWWTGTNPEKSEYTTLIEAISGYSNTKQVTTPETYNFYCMDIAGNISEVASQSYTSYGVHNLLNILDQEEGTYDATHYEEISSGSYIAPIGGSLAFDEIYTIPQYASVDTYKGLTNELWWLPSKPENLTLESNRVYYFWFDRNKHTVMLSKNTGIERIYYNINDAEEYEVTTLSDNLTVKGGSKVSLYATPAVGYTYTLTSLENPEVVNEVFENITFSPEATKRNDLSYTIVYEDVNHKIIHDTGTVENQTFEAVVTVEPTDIPWYYSPEPQEITITTTDITVVFTYTPRDDIHYTIRYLSTSGTVLSGVVEKQGVIDTRTDETAPEFSGYDAPEEDANIVLIADETQNIITFWYTPRNDIEYIVNYETQNGSGLAENVLVENNTMGSTVVETAKEIPWYTPLESEISLTLQATGNIITFVYKPNDYAIRFVDGSWVNETVIRTWAYLSTISDRTYPPMIYSWYTIHWDKEIPRKMPLGGDTITASWTAKTNTKYWIKYYYQESNGGYPDEPNFTRDRKGTTDTITGIIASDTVPARQMSNHVFDPENENNVLSTNINWDETWELKLYFKRQYTIKYLPWEKGSFTQQIVTWLDYNALTPEPTVDTGAHATGYNFSGWLPEIEERVTADVNYVAQWIGDAYTVSFDNNGWSGEMEDQTMYHGSSAKLSKNTFIRTGYAFAWWSKKANAAAPTYEDEQSVTNLTETGWDTVVLYAVWRAQAQTLTVNHYVMRLDGTYPDTPDESYTEWGGYTNQTVVWASIMQSLGNGFTLSWGTQSIVLESWDNVINYYYIRNQYPVIVYAREGFYDVSITPETESWYYYYGSEVTISWAIKPGYEWVNWTGSKFGRPGQVLPSQEELSFSITIEDYGVQYVANANIIPYTITYHLNGGSGEESQVYYVTTPTFDIQTPYKTWYTFLGWTEDDETWIPSTPITITEWTMGDKEYFAHYSENGYTIKFKDWEQEWTQNFNYTEKKKLEKNLLTKEGYEFSWWIADINDTIVYFEDEQEVEKLVEEAWVVLTFTAQWNANTYTISYDNNGGSGEMADQIRSYDDNQPLQKNSFERAWYTFLGWNTNSWSLSAIYTDEEDVGNMTSTNWDNIRLYAIWQANTDTPYTVYYYLENIDDENYTLEATDTTRSWETNTEVSVNELKKSITGANFEKAAVQVNEGWAEYWATATVDSITINGDGNAEVYLFYKRNRHTVTVSTGEGVGSVLWAWTYKYGQTVTLIPQDEIMSWVIATFNVTLQKDAHTASVEWAGTYNCWEEVNISAVPWTRYEFNAWMNWNTQISEQSSYSFVISGNVTYKATSKPMSGTQYKVVHWIKNIGASTYTKYLEETRAWETDEELTFGDYALFVPCGRYVNGSEDGGENGVGTPKKRTNILADESRVLNLFYDRNVRSLTVNKNDGIENTIITESYPDDIYECWEEITVSAIVKTGHHFTVWSSENITSSANNPYTFIMPDKAVTTQAQASANTYDVVFNANGWEGTMPSQNFTYGIAQELSDNLYTRVDSIVYW